jgi:hypothetical protein
MYVWKYHNETPLHNLHLMIKQNKTKGKSAAAFLRNSEVGGFISSFSSCIVALEKHETHKNSALPKDLP